MTHRTDSHIPTLSPGAMDAHVRKAHELRSQAFRAALKGAGRAVAGWKRPEAINHRFETMPEHLLADMGIARDPAADLLAGARNDNAPAGGQAAA